ncbi:MAG: lysophospholipid acyltransferase family protein [Xenococcaceae cyanobacterium]
MTQIFYPPRLNPLLVWFCQGIAPLGAKWLFRLELSVTPEALERVGTLGDERLLLLPNHPTYQDPPVMFLLSAKLQQAFHYLAAYEQFQGWTGGFYQRIGTYSVRRGLMDRPSFAQTLKLLTQPKCRLVMFPEGGCSFQNDTVMPFRAGAVEIALRAMSQLVKEGNSVPNLYAVPVSIKYRYTQDMMPIIQQTLTELEQALQVEASPGTNDYQRLRNVAQRVLEKVERDYGQPIPGWEQQSWNQRITLLRSQILEQCEQQLGIHANPDRPVRERTYQIRDALKTKADELEAIATDQSTEQPIDEQVLNYRLIEKSTKRLLNFDAIYDGYVAENPTPERFLDTLIRLEREVFDLDKPPPKGHRQATIEIGEPVNLKDAFADYQRDRKGTVNTLVNQLQRAVQEGLERLNQIEK